MPSVASAQTLDVLVDTTVGSGVTTGRGSGETITRRTPFFLEVDTGFVFDRDFATEIGLTGTLQLEDTPALALGPQIRLVRSLRWIGFYGGLGAPVFVTPFTRVGGELSAGVLYPLHARFSLLASAQVDVFFAGDDLPEDTTVIMFNTGLGGRVHF